MLAQTGAFVAMLGTDTLHVERFLRSKDRIVGTVVTRSPTTRVVRYEFRLDSTGRPTRYQVRTTNHDGTPQRAGANGWLDLAGDVLLRETAGEAKPDTQRIDATGPIFPGPSLPYLGVTFLTYELAFAEARGRATSAGESSIRLMTMIPRLTRPGMTKVWFIGADSVEMDYFGVARSRYKLAPDGRLLAADWTATTYGYRMVRIADLDVDAIASRWADNDRRGNAAGTLSRRDTTRGTVGDASVLIDYGSPAKRGREIWGQLVPWGRVWRLGADFATHMVLSADMRIGDTTVPAGTYTLWMLPELNGTSYLIVNRRTRIFGTGYPPADDLARIPLQHGPLSPPSERLTIEVRDGRLRINWDNRAWSVPVTRD